jgi:hypothetical protein
MTTLLIDLVLGFWLLLFGAMALLPILTAGGQRQPAREPEDRVISIAPARPAAARPATGHAPALPDNGHHERPAA